MGRYSRKTKDNQRNNLINQWRQVEDDYVVILLTSRLFQLLWKGPLCRFIQFFIIQRSR